MIVDRDGNVTIITQEKISIVDLVKKIEADYEAYKQTHLVINLTSLDQISLEDVIEFLRLSNTHRSDKKSFVLVSDKVDLNEMPDEIIVVPTLQEAFDIIEMEDIERDLDF
ncbi:ribonuclease Z [Winogradskyella sediminis]|uniref:ribonuclease Z n=1 Tax=Winogradskyella sediminis TaxID=1382466 RepID=UPI003AA9DFA1